MIPDTGSGQHRKEKAKRRPGGGKCGIIRAICTKPTSHAAGRRHERHRTAVVGRNLFWSRQLTAFFRPPVPAVIRPGLIGGHCSVSAQEIGGHCSVSAQENKEATKRFPPTRSQIASALIPPRAGKMKRCQLDKIVFSRTGLRYGYPSWLRQHCRRLTGFGIHGFAGLRSGRD
jgi:hypothetical protein